MFHDEIVEIRDHYALPSTDFIRELGPAGNFHFFFWLIKVIYYQFWCFKFNLPIIIIDFAKKLKTKDDGWDEAILGIASSVVAVSIFTGKSLVHSFNFAFPIIIFIFKLKFLHILLLHYIFFNFCFVWMLSWIFG